MGLLFSPVLVLLPVVEVSRVNRVVSPPYLQLCLYALVYSSELFSQLFSMSSLLRYPLFFLFSSVFGYFHSTTLPKATVSVSDLFR